ncbi:unnamed protein product [Gordionus sp. m RMFG-2023]|uniref:retinol dehydrogenase 13-like isoform X2 n=1 Tax=Gordionus sp. m RMFG-2023 TaxID=3053472 RepID=UPI0030E00D98
MSKLPSFTIITTVGAVCGGILIFKDYINGPVYKCKDNLKDQTVIITGSNKGIGKEIARTLASKNARIIMACRDMSKCEESRKEIVLETKNPNVICKYLNLASFKSINTFAQNITKSETNINILINNAGIMNCPKSFTQNGFEAHFGVNYLGHFLLTYLLLPKLLSQDNNDNRPSKIINVIDKSFIGGILDLEMIKEERNRNLQVINKTNKNNRDNIDQPLLEYADTKYEAMQAYMDSKLALVLMSDSLAHNYKSKLKVYCVDPGLVNTELRRYLPYKKSQLARYTWRSIFEYMFMKDARHAAQTAIYASLHEIGDSAKKEDDVIYVTSKNGRFIETPLAKIVDPDDRKEKLSRELWELSINWAQYANQS